VKFINEYKKKQNSINSDIKKKIKNTHTVPIRIRKVRRKMAKPKIVENPVRKDLSEI